jgi:hypothetical protein
MISFHVFQLFPTDVLVLFLNVISQLTKRFNSSIASSSICPFFRIYWFHQLQQALIILYIAITTMKLLNDIISTIASVAFNWTSNHKNNKRPSNLSPVREKKRTCVTDHDRFNKVLQSEPSHPFVDDPYTSIDSTSPVGYERVCSDGPIESVKTDSTGNEQQAPDYKIGLYCFEGGTAGEQQRNGCDVPHKKYCDVIDRKKSDNASFVVDPFNSTETSTKTTFTDIKSTKINETDKASFVVDPLYSTETSTKSNVANIKSINILNETDKVSFVVDPFNSTETTTKSNFADIFSTTINETDKASFVVDPFTSTETSTKSNSADIKDTKVINETVAIHVPPSDLDNHYNIYHINHSTKKKERKDATAIFKYLKSFGVDGHNFCDPAIKSNIVLKYTIEGNEYRTNHVEILRPMYADQNEKDLDDIVWKLSVGGKKIPLRHLVVSNALCKYMVFSSGIDDKKLICLNMFKNENKINNESTLHTKSTSSVKRNVYGYSFLFCLCDTHISKLKIRNERMSRVHFAETYPNITHAFAENWNLHRVHHQEKGEGNLVIIESSKDQFHLCISIYTNKEKGIYLRWKGLHCSFNTTSFANQSYEEIQKQWQIVTYNNNAVTGYYCNQVFGPLIKLIIDSNTSYSKSQHFTISTKGPSILSIPLPNQLPVSSQDIVPTIYNIIYVLPNPNSTPTTLHKDTKLLIPIFYASTSTTICGHSIGIFANLHKGCIHSLSPKLEDTEFKSYVNKNMHGSFYKRLIPSSSFNTRIIVINKEEYKKRESSLPGYYLNGISYLFGTESQSLDIQEDNGVMVSTFGVEYDSLSIIKKEINFDTIKTIHDVYGSGTQRHRCNHLGFATYRGTKNSLRPQPLPFVDEKEIQDHQYYMQSQQSNALLQTSCEKLVFILGEHAENYGKKVYPQLYNIIGKSCDKSILTCGSPSTYYKKNYNTGKTTTVKNRTKNWLGFSCSDHVDSCDHLTNDSLSCHFKSLCLTKYMTKFYVRLGGGMPTTCQYFHVWKKEVDREKYSVVSYFMYNGLGIAVEIVDYRSITFLGFAFSHCTSLCYLFDSENKVYIFKNVNDMFSLMGWGRSGGGKEYKRNM